MPFLEVWKTKLFYLNSEGEGGRGHRVLFLHGAGGNCRRWEDQVRALQTQHQPVALDLPGHGASEGLPCEQVFLYREWVEEFVAALGWDKFVLGGHSLGGAIALNFAVKYPFQLEGLILVSTGARLRVYPERLMSYQRGEYNPEWQRDSFAPTAPEELIQEAMAEAATVSPKVRYLDFLACDRFDFLNVVKEIKIPTQVVCGREDRMTPVKYSEFLASQIQGARLAVVPDAGHMVLREQPAAVNEVILDFLRTL